MQTPQVEHSSERRPILFQRCAAQDLWGALLAGTAAIGRAFLQKATGPVLVPHDSTTVVCGETTYLCVTLVTLGRHGGDW